MNHQIAGRRFGRNTAQRRALTKCQVTALLHHGRITTTEAKAKELRRWADRVVTAAKGEDRLAARRAVGRWISERETINKLFDVYLPKLKDRPGGYTRVMLLGPRHGDNAPMAMVELVGIQES